MLFFFVAFVLVLVWAVGRRNKGYEEHMKRLPLEDEKDGSCSWLSTEAERRSVERSQDA
jgi:cbb3-type cytochrome oxidase subunit 3